MTTSRLPAPRRTRSTQASAASGGGRRPGAASPAAVWVALVVVYVVWGSTYLAIRIMVEDMPPLLAAGARFLAAGLVLAALLAVRGGPRALRVTPRQLAGCTLLGLLLPACGNGLVTVGERNVASGVAALLVAAVPLWVVVLRTVSGDRPGRLTWAGVLIGFAGLLVLLRPGGGSTDLPHALLIVVATVGWSIGSWSQSRLDLPASPFVTTVYEMLAGGVIMLVAGPLLGERTDLTGYAASSWLAWGYLVVFGSLVAFSAYVWLVGQAPLSLVSTYAYVNPVVAVVLGALVLAEPVTASVLVGGAVVVAGVAVVVGGERLGRRRRGAADGDDLPAPVAEAEPAA